MQPVTARRLTFDELTHEISHNDRQIAYALNQQASDASSPQAAEAAQSIIELYRRGVEPGIEPNEAEAVRAECLGRYDAWRYQFAELTGPIAAALGHPMPLPSSNGDPDAVAPVDSIFAKPKPPSAGKPVAVKHPAGVETADAGVAITEQKPAQAASRKVRRAWSQSDVVKLTQAFMQLPQSQDPKIAAAAFMVNIRPDFEIDEVIGKAVELELMEAPALAPKPELSDSDKKLLEKRVRENLSADSLSVERRLLELKYAAGVLRELIKTLAG